jgi:hypothetical protein
MERPEEFKEIAHSGGQVVISVTTDEKGHRRYQQTWQHQRPVPAGIFAIYAMAPHGIPVCQVPLGGIGQAIPRPPVPGCVMVFIGSDSEGLYGQQCPACNGYWRSKLGHVCPYCGQRRETHNLLTAAQRSYVQQYCRRLAEIVEKGEDGDHIIDMDAVADAARKDTEKPPFYYAEESQQHQFTCHACDEMTDILGTYGYCSSCGTRNDLQEMTEKIIPAIRDRINAGGPYEACVRDVVAAFDSLAGRYVEQLLASVAMTPGRRERLGRIRFHNISVTATELKQVFDIDILDGVSDADRAFAQLMFHRRHVYEHRGGEADEKYIEDSGDKSVRIKQALRETVQSAHQIASIVQRMATNIHSGFHEIVPVEPGPIYRHQEHLKRAAALRR